MNRLYILALIICYTLLSNSCKKDKNTNDIYDNVPGLPPATQIGANTFGCLVNGVPWVPQGSIGTNNLSIDFDPGILNGYFSVFSYNTSTINTTYIILGIRDSVNFLFSGKHISIGRNDLGAFLYNESGVCRSYTDDIPIYSSGNILISKFDKSSRIIAGLFKCILFNPSCNDTIKITNGRFDFKF